MSWYRVEARRSAPPSIGRAALLVVLLLAALAVVYSWFLPSAVTVDGRSVRIDWDTTVGDLVRTGVVKRVPGDLLSAADRSVVVTGGGEPLRVFVDGERASFDDRMRPGEVVRTEDGSDVMESVVETEQPLVAPVISNGGGSIARVVRKGKAGLRWVKMGAVSGDLIDVTTMTAPVATLVERVDPVLPEGKYVAFTFDDGPWPSQTRAILDILQAQGVRATFFQVGHNVDRYPEISRLVLERGMVIGNHTHTHRNLTKATYREVYEEMSTAQTAIHRATGYRSRWFRPPGGNVSTSVYANSDALGLRLVMWNVDPQDWKKPPTSVLIKRVLDNVRPGAVILMHDGGGDRTHTIEALPVIIRALRKQGYSFVTLDEFPGADGTGAYAVKRWP